jgi:hypothetical protein
MQTNETSGKVESFTQQVDPDQDIEVSRAQSAQNLHSLDCVDIAVQVTHL